MLALATQCGPRTEGRFILTRVYNDAKHALWSVALDGSRAEELIATIAGGRYDWRSHFYRRADILAGRKYLLYTRSNGGGLLWLLKLR